MRDGNKLIEGYVKYFGPSTEDGSVDISKAGKSLIALDNLFQKYQVLVLGEKEFGYILKIKDVRQNCSELTVEVQRILIEHKTEIKSVLAMAKGPLIFATKFAIGSITTGFFGTIGAQVALRAFFRGKEIRGKKDVLKKGEPFTQLENIDNEIKEIPTEEWNLYKKMESSLAGLVQLEKGREEEMRIGYNQNGKSVDVAKIHYKEKKYFDKYEGCSTEERMKEVFDDENARDERIIGKFVDFYGMAHKYKFAFQARKNQEDIGKKKILCIVEEDQVSNILDYLKPENGKNVCIFGKAVRDWENKVDKIKIAWTSEDEDFNPEQTNVLDGIKNK